MVATNVLCYAISKAAKMSHARDYGVSCNVVDLIPAMRVYFTAKLADELPSCEDSAKLSSFVSYQTIPNVTVTTVIRTSCEISIEDVDGSPTCEAVAITVVQ